ncbi:MAG: HlyD family efflux transporter periplasmic adaptor subunit [Candidatus Onthomonas sp.]
MKPGKNVVRAIMLLLFLGAVAYFAVYAYHIFFGGYETATVYSYIGQSTLPAEGYLIREETVLSDGGSLEEIVVAEGENVALGDVVARVYSSENALEQHRRLEALETERDRLEYIYSRGTEESDAMRLNGEIVEAMTDLKAASARQDFSKLEDRVENLKDLIFRRGFTYSTGSALADQIDAVEAQISELRSATESAVSTVYSPAAGIFSGLVDGYESCLTAEALENLTPATLEALAQSRAETSGRELGKVITSFRWYYAATMSRDVTKYLSSGDTVTVNFEGSTGAQKMTVQSISSADENDRVAVVFTSDRNISATTLLREQNVDVAYGICEGLRIPTRALRADQETGQLGVYRISGAQAQWVPVELIFTGSDYYLVRSVSKENQSELQEAERLKTGDEVLVRGKNIYDGKVIK